MSRKKTQPKKIPVLDSKFKSAIVPKLINSIMYDGKKIVAQKIIYEAIEKLLPEVKKNCTTKFDESIDVSFSLNLKQKKNLLIYFMKLLTI